MKKYGNKKSLYRMLHLLHLLHFVFKSIPVSAISAAMY